MRIPRSVREEVRKKYNGRCAYCGEQLKPRWEVDHLIPLRRDRNGGCRNPENHNFENFMPSCVSCNRDKRNMSLEQWRSTLLHKVELLSSESPMFRMVKRFGMIEIVDLEEIRFYFESFEDGE